MAKRPNVVIKTTQLEHWLKIMQDNFHVLNIDGEHVVLEMKEVLQTAEKGINQATFLKMADLVEGEEYQFSTKRDLHEWIRGKRVRVIRKKKTKVLVELLEDTLKWPKGITIDTRPESLEKI